MAPCEVLEAQLFSSRTENISGLTKIKLDSSTFIYSSSQIYVLRKQRLAKTEKRESCLRKLLEKNTCCTCVQTCVLMQTLP